LPQYEKGEFRKSGIIRSLKQSSTPSSGHSSPLTLLPEAIQFTNYHSDNDISFVEDSLNWFHNSCDPWELVKQH
jgi:hypothetical protein